MRHSLLSSISGKLLFITIACIVLSCGTSDSPETTVKEFLRSIDNFEYDKAEACITANYQESLNNIKKASTDWSEAQRQEYKNKPKPYLLTLKEKTDSTAAVFVNSDIDSGMPMRMMFLLKKKNGRWLIDKTDD